MAYTDQGIDQRAEILSGATDSLVYWPRVEGEPVIPSAAYVTVYGPSGSELVARVAVTPDTTTGKLALAQAWPLVDYAIDQDYAALWEFTADSVAHADRQFFDVVKSKLPILIDANDLEEVYPNLNAHLKAVGVAEPTRFIRRAWSEMLDRIRGAGYRPSLILERSRLVNPGLQLALKYACGALVRREGDVWDKRFDGHDKSFETLFRGLGSLKYDTNEDATAGDGEPARVNRNRMSV